MNNRFLKFALLVLALGVSSVAQQVSPSPRDQLKQYVAELQKNPSDDAPREKIIKLVLTLQPPPVVPPEAKEHEGAAEFAFKHVQSPSDFKNAAAEYEKALLVAPWIASDYYNLGVSCDKSGDLEKAIAAYRLYLVAAPEAKDADEVLKQIGALKYELAQKQKQGRAEAEAAAAAERERQARRRFDGRYVCHVEGQVRGSATSEDDILDIREGVAHFGTILRSASGVYAAVLADRIGRYEEGKLIIPVPGPNFHHQEYYDNGGSRITDGVISDDGTRITVTTTLIYPEGTRTHPPVCVYHRQ